MDPGLNAVPLCPRCGYDQSGACAAWRTECPLEGTCPECGRAFEWGAALGYKCQPLRWLFEHKPRRSLGVLRAWRSWARTLVPGRFWRSVSLAHKTSPAVWLWPVVLFVSMIAVCGAGRAIAGCFAKYPWFPYVMTGSFAGRPPRPDGPGLAERVLDFLWVYWCYPLWYGNYGGWTNEQYLRQLLGVWAVPAATVAAALTCSFSVILLRRSRRVASVRTAHVVRARVYRLAPLVVFYTVWIACFAARELSPASWVRNWEGRVFSLLLVWSLAWGWLWWWTAIRRGSRMPDARLLAALIGTIDVLASAAVFLWMAPFALTEVSL